MSRPLVFLSFDLANNEAERVRFTGQMETCSTAFSAPYCSEEGQPPQLLRDAQIRDKLDSCDLVIVLVGKQTAAAANVEREIAFAKHRNVPFFGVYVGDADASSGLPPGLPANRTIPCDWMRIASAIDQLMSEGKHHVFR